jgi:hypothetical protein
MQNILKGHNKFKQLHHYEVRQIHEWLDIISLPLRYLYFHFDGYLFNRNIVDTISQNKKCLLCYSFDVVVSSFNEFKFEFVSA